MPSACRARSARRRRRALLPRAIKIVASLLTKKKWRENRPLLNQNSTKSSKRRVQPFSGTSPTKCLQGCPQEKSEKIFAALLKNKSSLLTKKKSREKVFG